MLTFYGSRGENKVALTFDDGPNPYGTHRVLDILEDYDVKGNFFLIGKWARLYPDIVDAIQRKGHLIGNHGYMHSHMIRDARKTALELSRTTSEEPRYIRPPYGNLLLYLPEVFSRETFVVLGDVWAFDWGKPQSDAIFRNVVNNVRNGSIVILHDGSEKEGENKRCEEMLYALPRIIEHLSKEYELVRLDEMDTMQITPSHFASMPVNYLLGKLKSRIHQDVP